MMNQFYKTLLFLVAASMFVACDQDPENTEKEPLRLVRTLKLTLPDGDNWREFSGVVEAARKAELSFRVSGKLQRLVVKEGDRVEKDQLLAQIDPTDFEIQLNSRKVEFNKADADFQRAERLIKKDAISRSDYEDLKTQRETSRAGLAAAQQNVAYTSLKSPFSGRIATRHVENFEEVRAMQQIYMLQDLSSLTIKIDVPESVMINVREGSNPEIYAVFAQIPDRKFPLTIKEVSTQADAQSNTFAVSFSMPVIDDVNVLPGMSVSVRAKPDPRQQSPQTAMQVPAHAVLEDEDGRFVYVVKRKGDNLGIIEKRLVEVGELKEAGLMINQGLQVGDEVVTAGMSKMSVGLEVRLDEEYTQ